MSGERSRKCFKRLFLFLIFIVSGMPIFFSCRPPAPAGLGERLWDNSGLKLWYGRPAERWAEALPVGNGRLGAMIFGGVRRDRIQINEESLWAGQKLYTDNPDALKDLGKIRALIFAGDIKEAYELGNKSLLGTPPRFRSYQTFCDLYLLSDSTAPYSGYRRELLLNRGISRTQFTVDGVTFVREIFASAPDNLIVVHLSADQQGAISTTITLKRAQDAVVKAENNEHRSIILNVYSLNFIH
jgi:alpha-L-fucosidase 2